MEIVLVESGELGIRWHAHKAGCRDIARYRSAYPWTLSAQTVRDIVLELYRPNEFVYDPENAEEYRVYRDDVKVFPCLSELEEG